MELMPDEISQYMISLMRNLRNKTNEQRGERKERKRGIPKIFLIIENKLDG